MLDTAKRLAKMAGEEALRLRAEGLEVQSKREGVVSDIVTQADGVAERIVVEGIRRQFSDHAIVGEEGSKKGGESEYCWVIDPVDGTIPYAKGLDGFGVNVGVLKNGRPFIGAINLPAIGLLVWGKVGGAAGVNDDELGLSRVDNLGEAILGLEYGHSGGRARWFDKVMRPLVDNVRYPMVPACVAWGLANVAMGKLDAYIHKAYPWDFVAGAAIIRAVGGKVTGLEGEEPDWLADEYAIVASNGLLHGKLLEKLRK